MEGCGHGREKREELWTFEKWHVSQLSGQILGEHGARG